MTTVRLPANNWRPRPYQRKLWRYLERGGLRAIEIAHRRWGKDDVALNWAACSAHTRIGNIFHCLPEYAQARKAIWTAVNPHTGKRRIDEAFPLDIRETTHEQEMFIRFKTGSTWQVIGSDNYKNLVGGSVNGLVLSEWAKAHPAAWAYLAPILVENNGWGLFITTPEGENHAHMTYTMAKADPTWHAELQTVIDTGAISLEAIEQQRLEYHAIFGKDAGDALIEQEYFCSFSAAILGAYWGKQMETAEREGRICALDVLEHYPVNRAWDIGIDDPMAIWCYQSGPGWLHVVDYIEGSGSGFDWYAGELRARGYLENKRGVDWVPHDAKQREPGSQGRSRIASMKLEGLNPVLVPDHKPMDRINAGRRLIPQAHFDRERCKQGIACLRNYKQKWDEKVRTFMLHPAHDWSSHGADAWGHLSVAVDIAKPKQQGKTSTSVAFPAITVNDLLEYAKRGRRDRKWG
jgi:phage terminase large subunit